jgi:hypothetical protein
MTSGQRGVDETRLQAADDEAELADQDPTDMPFSAFTYRFSILLYYHKPLHLYEKKCY